MATRADQYRSAQERKKKTVKKKVKKPPRTPHENLHAAAKATHALEARSESGRASRKSTRSSANRIKADAPLNLVEALKKGSPEARYRRSAAQERRGKRG